MTEKLIDVKVYSPILDKNIRNNIESSPIWKDSYTEDEDKPTGAPMVCYHMKFNGLKPVQVTKIK